MTGDGEVRPEIDPDEDGRGEDRERMRRLHRHAGDEAQRKVVDDVVSDPDHARDEGAPRVPVGRRPRDATGGDVDRADALDRRDHHEEPGHEDKGAPAHVPREPDRASPRCDRGDHDDEQRRRERREPEIDPSLQGDEKHRRDEPETNEHAVAAPAKRHPLRCGLERLRSSRRNTSRSAP